MFATATGIIGATVTLQALKDDPRTPAALCEALGLKETAEQSFAMLRPGGTATIIGMVPFGTKIELHGFDFLRERKIQGSSMGSNRFRVDMPRLLGLWKQGRLHLEAVEWGWAQPVWVSPAFFAAVRNVFSCKCGEHAATTTRVSPSSLISFSINSCPKLEHMNLYSRAMTTPCLPSFSCAHLATSTTSTTPAMFDPQ